MSRERDEPACDAVRLPTSNLTGAHFQPLRLVPSFGFGDRIGLATPGHVEAMKQAGQGIAPIFAQQSIREMMRTGRTPDQVLSSAASGMQTAGWSGTSGADADHLKTCDDIDATVTAGFTFFTLDPSDFVNARADFEDSVVLIEQWRQFPRRAAWIDRYLNKRIAVSRGQAIVIDEMALMKCAAKYGRAIEYAIVLARYLMNKTAHRQQQVDIELSIDETPHPTSLVEHFIIVDQVRQQGIQLTSVAPRLVGQFEKGVEYTGDFAELRCSLTDHASIARMLGPYKLSLHSGSDKLSVYPILAEVTRGQFHIKTAGTSYLESLRVVARFDQGLFRRIVDRARYHYHSDRATYRVTADVSTLPPGKADVPIHDLERLYLGAWSEVPEGRGFMARGRQILHCTFGSILKDPVTKARVTELLHSYSSEYIELLAEHFIRHVQPIASAI